MHGNLTQNEYEILILYYRKDKGELNMEGLIKKQDPDDKILRNLCEKGYINGRWENGIKNIEEEGRVSTDLSINGYYLSDLAIAEFDLDLPPKI